MPRSSVPRMAQLRQLAKITLLNDGSLIKSMSKADAASLIKSLHGTPRGAKANPQESELQNQSYLRPSPRVSLDYISNTNITTNLDETALSDAKFTYTEVPDIISDFGGKSPRNAGTRSDHSFESSFTLNSNLKYMILLIKINLRKY